MDEKVRKFVAVATHGSFAQAAQQLHVSQPALSMAVKQLERELGVSLFERDGRRSILTAAGRAVLETARGISVSLDDLGNHLRELQQQKPHFRLGLIDSMADLLFVYHDMFSEIGQKAELSLTVDSSRRLIDQVIAGDLQSALVVSPQEELSPRLTLQSLGSEPLAVVAAASLQCSHEATLPYISYNPQASSHKLIEASLASRDISYSVVMHSTSPDVMLQLCLRGIGFSVLPYTLVAEYVERGELAYLGGNYPQHIDRPIVGVTSKQARPNSLSEQVFSQAAVYLQSIQAKN